LLRDADIPERCSRQMKPEVNDLGYTYLIEL